MTSVPALSAAFRIARRDAWRHRGRSALIISMVLVPVFGLSCADVLARTMQLSPTEKVTRTIGHFDVGMRIGGGHVVQGADPLDQGYNETTPPGYKGPGIPYRVGSAPYLALERRALSIVGATSNVQVAKTAPVVVTNNNGQVSSELTELDLRDSLTSGLASIKHGTAPASAGQVAVSTNLASRMSLHVGDQIGFANSVRKITAIVSVPSDPKGADVYVLPGTANVTHQVDAIVMAATTQPVTWATVQKLNAVGVIASSRSVVANPPKGIPGPFNTPSALATRDAVGVETVAVGMAILEVVLLAGAAFAVGIRRQRHDLALVGAVGGDASTVRAVVLGTGVLLGLTGAVLGIVVGVAFAPVVLPIVANHTGRAPGHFDLRPLELLAVAVLGTITGLLAAWLPSRTAAKDDVILGLTGRRGVLRSQKRVPMIGVAMIVLGIVIAVQATHHFHFRVILGGAVLAELGFVVCAPALVGLVGRLSRFVGLAPRLALRDAARHRGRSGPAVAAIMAGVAGAIAVSTYFSTNEHNEKANYLPQAAIGQSVAELFTKQTPAQLSAVTTTLQTALGADKVVPLQIVNCVMVKQHCSEVYTRSADAGSTQAAVGGPAMLTTLLGHPDPAGAAVLQAGGIVYFQSQQNVPASDVAGFGDQKGRTILTHVKSYVAYVGKRGTSVPALVSPAAAAKYKLHSQVTAVLAVTSKVPSQSQIDRANLSLPTNSYLTVGKPYTAGDLSVGLIVLAIVASIVTLGATAVAVGLSMAESKPDLMTLTAVGSRPLTRRLLVASQAGTISILGSVQGVVAGLIPAWAILRALHRPNFHLPWSTIGIVVVVIPLLAMIGTALAAGSRLTLDRRLS